MKESFTIKNRIASIDLLRGVVVMLMALDHTRAYFHADAMLFAPADLTHTTVPIFLTRWITHFCAPAFVFLAGASAFLIGLRKSTKNLSLFLLARGSWLVFLELTIVNFGWSFNIHLPFFVLGVIWALGISMIALACLVYLPYRIILSIGLLIVFGHNLLDTIPGPGDNIKAFLWYVLHESNFNNPAYWFRFLGRTIVIDYSVLPWIGVIALGYCCGYVYQPQIPAAVRKKWLFIIGGATTLLFIVLRIVNIYGDSRPWAVQHSAAFSFLSFLRVTKYPPSLQFILMTLGPAILFLALTEKRVGLLAKPVLHVGRVPMFFYLTHIYLIHALALIAAKLTGYNWEQMVSQQPLTPIIKRYGFSLGMVYFVWIVILATLYPLCKWYDKYKSSHKEKWWLSYL